MNKNKPRKPTEILPPLLFTPPCTNAPINYEKKTRVSFPGLSFISGSL